MGLQQVLDNMIATGKPVLLQLRDTNQPMGPGKVEKVTTPEWIVVKSDDRTNTYGPYTTAEAANRCMATLATPGHEVVERQVWSGLCRILCPAILQATPQSRPVKMIQPIVFSVDDLLLIYEETLTADGEKANLTPADNQGQGRGGLVIPGR